VPHKYYINLSMNNSKDLLSPFKIGSTLSSRDIDPYFNLESEIYRLKKELNAVILKHYYQNSEIKILQILLETRWSYQEKLPKLMLTLLSFVALNLWQSLR
jgi:hypothetical protein